MVDKKLKLKLVGIDGNAMNLLGAFQYQARKEKWTKDEISEVLYEAKSGNYAHLVATLSNHCYGGGI